jgi:phosphopantothenate-cysteine ligase/phosphopantothenoylcysteine decarboxylase/phosphopantothenate--cysteine ligase
MRILVTAGNTQTPIDEVRCITNIFSGRTGAHVALEAHRRGHAVELFTSHPEAVQSLTSSPPTPDPAWRVRPFRTFADLRSMMFEELADQRCRRFAAIIHAAAVSDYEVAGIYAPRPPAAGAVAWEDRLEDVQAGKVKSNHAELWLKLVRTEKLVDLIRGPFGFTGVLVKFKLEVGTSDEDLLAIAEQSRQQSQADLMVANTLEGMTTWAYVGPLDGRYRRVPRGDLSAHVLDAVATFSSQQTKGA